jgi:hypothetical protein
MELATNETNNRSLVASLGRGITQSNLLSLLEYKFMLNQEKFQLTSPQGVNLQFGYYCMWNFVIHGA